MVQGCLVYRRVATIAGCALGDTSRKASETMRIRLLLGLTGLAVLVGCDSSAPPSAPAPIVPTAPVVPTAPAMPTDPQAMYDRWKAIVTNPAENAQSLEAFNLAAELSKSSPELVDKMVDLLVDPTTSQDSRYMIMTCLDAAYSPNLLPRMLTLVEPGVDPVIRTLVTINLTRLNDPQAQEKVRQLVNDPERRVKLAALSGLVEMGDQDSRKVLQEYYFTEGLPAEYRGRIVHVLSTMPQASEAPLYIAALQDGTVDEASRLLAVSAVGRMGEVSALPALEAVANDAASPEELKKIAASAVNVIKEKAGQSSASTAPATEPTPAPEPAPAETPTAAP